MDYVEYFYTEVYGFYPFITDNEKLESQKVITYLEDCGLTRIEILKVVESYNEYNKLTFDNLPNWLWEGSLIKKDTFYYHSLLHMLSAPPKWNPVTGEKTKSKFSIEMVIMFTVQDILRYFYNSFNICSDLIDDKRDEGSVKFLLSKYKYDFIEPLDFLLALIDYAKNELSNGINITNILNVTQFESEVYAKLKVMTTEAVISKSNFIVWR